LRDSLSIALAPAGKPTSRWESRRAVFPVAERVSKEIISLPMYPELTAEGVQTVAQQQ
jgi:dTDP-4-amino-4,6-dideoxygalactose transaminase